MSGTPAVGDKGWLINIGGGKRIAISLNGGVPPTPGTLLKKFAISPTGIYIGNGTGIWAVNETTVYHYSITGSFIGSFSTSPYTGSLWDIVVDSTGNIYVSALSGDYSSYITKFKSDGTYITRWDASVSYMDRLCIDSLNRIYLQTSSTTIGVYNTTGTLLGSIGMSGALAPGAGIDLDGAKNVYIAILDLAQIRKESSDWINEAWNVGTSGSGDLQFNSPWGLAVDKETGYIYVSDRGNNRIEILNPDGTYKGQWTSYVEGGETKYFANLGDIAVDSRSGVYVVCSAGLLKFAGLT